MIVLDWDAEVGDALGNGCVGVPDKFGRQSLAVVSSRETEPLRAMKNTPIKAALQRAEFLYGKI